MPMVIVSYGVGLGIEFAYAVFRGHEVNEGYLVTGLLIPLIMPIDFPLWMLAVSVFFAVIIGKEAFGGTGMNILNPALVARAFALFAYAPFMSGNEVWVADSVADGVSGETILGALYGGTVPQTSVFDMFMGFIPGSVGETSVLMILIGAVFLLFTGIASWRIMLSCLLGAALMGLIFNTIGSTTNELLNFPWWQHLLVGGFMFGLVFMATDPVTAAQTTKGKWIYGFLIGIFAILIRVVNPTLPEGMMMAILLMNVFAPTIDHYVIEGNVKRRKKRLLKVKA
jgi:Na+-transporting NADH:ubiquinone oxidoreductase subunit B